VIPMPEINSLIYKKIDECEASEDVKKFLRKVLLLELQTSSEGVKYRYGKELELEIKNYSKNFKVSKNED
jgi:hypothetical protein